MSYTSDSTHSETRVVVVQSGARHDYAIPAAFAREGMLETFYTDICAGRGLGRLAEAMLPLPLPARTNAALRRLASRRPPVEVLACTVTDDWHALAHELLQLSVESPARQRQLLRSHSARRGVRLAKRGLGRATHLFNVLGEGGELASRARNEGIPVLSDVIVALSTARIHWVEYEAFPEWGPPPPDSPEGGFPTPNLLLETTDVFVCPSQFVADDLVENFGVDRKATRVVPYGVPESWFSIMPRPERGRILFVGTADRRKGIHYLAKASTELGRSSQAVQVRVAGGAHDLVRTQAESSALTFLGRIPRSEIVKEFSTADVFVLPTLAEGSATVIYEAMAAGLPVVTTRAAGASIEDGVDGLIVPERDPLALAAAIERLVCDRALRDRIAAAARAKARTNFGWDTWAKHLVQVVKETPPGSTRTEPSGSVAQIG